MRSDLLARWPAVSALLDEALALDAAARRAWLEALPPQHDELKPLIARLLSRHAEAAVVFETFPRTTVARPVDDGARAGARIGAYRLLSLIGRGGMGTVWLAERIQTGAQLPVAIKLPAVEGQASQIAERFERERQILAALNHPNIARLYEAGVTEEGRPFLALEYVEGESLVAHCNRRGLSARQRLELFVQVLRAVQYAHANLVIHRDLKPSNIIVTAAGEVKLLDFGIAKLLDRETRSAERTQLTEVYGQLMTLDYASPEQVRGETLGTTSDVYALGVVLFELLTGTRPYRLKRGSRAELEEAILTSDTSRPSSSVTAAFATSMSSSIARWRRTLRGDLDTIVLKALEKNGAARYPTAEALAQDCERYLNRLPVLARPQSKMYRFRKFVGRHRLALGAASIVTLALIVGLGVALWQARVALAQSRVAQEEARKQEAVQSFLTALFDKNKRSQPNAAKARSMTVRELLLEASDRVQGSLSETPTVKLELLNTVAQLLRDIDEYERAAALSTAAVQVARSANLTKSDAYVEALMGQAAAARLLGQGAEAVAARDESLRILDARGDQTSLLRARANTNTVAQFATDPLRETELVQHAVELFETRYSTEPQFFTALFYLGNLLRTQQRHAEAEQAFRRAIAMFDRVHSRDYTNLGASYGFAGECGLALGKVRASLRDRQQALEILEKNAGPQALVTRFHRSEYAEALYESGRLDLARGVFDSLSRDVSPQARNVVDFDASVYEAFALMDSGRPREAQLVLERFNDNWVDFGRRFLPNGARWVAELAYAQAMQGRGAEARKTLLLLGKLPKLFYGADIETGAEYAAEAAWVHLSLGDIKAAQSVLAKAAVGSGEKPKRFDWGYVRLNVQASFVSLQDAAPEKALSYADAALAHLHSFAEADGFPYLETRARVARGQALLALGRTSEAVSDLDAAMGRMRTLHSPDSPWLIDVLASRALAARKLGDDAGAQSLLTEARMIARRNAELSPWFLRQLREAESTRL
jgi:eukaryotic-like serine/threonine-protein kinase